VTQTPTPTKEGSVAPADLQDERLIRPTGVRENLAAQIKRVRTGDLGSLPVVIGLVIICAVFQVLDNVFLGAENLSFLLLNASFYGVVSVGIVLVLLLGQIDLSVGSMSGFAAAIYGITLTQAHWPEWLVIVAAIAAGCLVGLLYGFLFVRFSVPSFVITLAGLLALLGAQFSSPSSSTCRRGSRTRWSSSRPVATRLRPSRRHAAARRRVFRPREPQGS